MPLPVYFDPVACEAGSGISSESYALITGSAIFAVMVLVTLILRLQIERQNEAAIGDYSHVEMYGVLALFLVFFLCAGLGVGGLVTNCTLGCSSFAAHCGSLSCIFSNLLPQGYVYICVLLVLASVIFLYYINGMASLRVRSEHGKLDLVRRVSWCRMAVIGEWTMRVGVLLTVLTGILPAPTNNCGIVPEQVMTLAGDDCFYANSNVVHAVGAVGGVLLAAVGLVLRMTAPVYVFRGGDEVIKAWPCSRTNPHSLFSDRALGGLAIIVWLNLVVAVVMFSLYVTLETMTIAKTVDTCLNYRSREACLGLDLPQAQFNWAKERLQSSDPEHLSTDGWQCEWSETRAFTYAPCTAINCDRDGRLSRFKYSTTFEYLGLIFSTYAMGVGLELIKLRESRLFGYEGIQSVAAGSGRGRPMVTTMSARGATTHGNVDLDFA